jgi:hypothetical protein
MNAVQPASVSIDPRSSDIIRVQMLSTSWSILKQNIGAGSHVRGTGKDARRERSFNR